MENALEIKSILKQSWKSLKGSKWAIWIYLIPSYIVMRIPSLLIKPKHLVGNFFITTITHAVVLHFIYMLIAIAIAAPLVTTAVLTAVKRARGQTVYYNDGYSYFDRWFSIALASCIIYLLYPITAMLGIATANHVILLSAVLMFFVLHPLFLLVLPLIADKKLGVFSAFRESIRLVLNNWFKIFLLLLTASFIFIVCYGLIVIFSVIVDVVLAAFFHTISLNHMMNLLSFSLRILLMVWFIPYYFMIIGRVYHQLVDN